MINFIYYKVPIKQKCYNKFVFYTRHLGVKNKNYVPKNNILSIVNHNSLFSNYNIIYNIVSIIGI